MDKNISLKKLFSSVTGFLKNKYALFGIMIIGVIIMLAAESFALGEQTSVPDDKNLSYCRSLEENLAGILSGMKGVGKVRVMITPENTENSYGGFFGNENRENTGIKGVVIAAEGASDPSVNEKIYYAAKAALNIGGSRIAVIESE